MNGKRSRDKGGRNERAIVNLLRELGVQAKRVPLSGACDGFKGDVQIKKCLFPNVSPGCPSSPNPMANPLRCGCEPKVAECKVRANGFRQIYRWLGDNDLLFLRSDRNEWLVVQKVTDWVGE